MDKLNQNEATDLFWLARRVGEGKAFTFQKRFAFLLNSTVWPKKPKAFCYCQSASFDLQREVKFVHSKKASIKEKSNTEIFLRPLYIETEKQGTKQVFFFSYLPFCGLDIFNIPL